MILEAALLHVPPEKQEDFESAFRQASPIIARTVGYQSHQLQRCLETPGQYLLLVQWDTLESHTINFRQSPHYLEWKALLHHFYDPFPTVEHYTAVDLNGAPS